MGRPRRIDDLVKDLLPRLDLRAKSLLVTIFGDSIAPQGGAVWLGSLIALAAPFGLNERVVRTAVFRLSRDEWLKARAFGRRSLYSLTESGRRRFDEAHRRIYAPAPPPWDGFWHILLLDLDRLAAERREKLRRELYWLGFGQVAAGVFAHPRIDDKEVRLRLQELHTDQRVVLMRARADTFEQGAALKALVHNSWDVKGLDRGYREFLQHFQPLYQELGQGETAMPETCFMLRTLLIHDYRRVLLRDPILPDELLPRAWSGSAARKLCGDLYRLTQQPADQYVQSMLEREAKAGARQGGRAAAGRREHRKALS